MTTSPNEPEALPAEGQHPDDDPSVTVDPADEQEEDDFDTEPHYDHELDLPDGAPDPGDEPIVDEGSDDE